MTRRALITGAGGNIGCKAAAALSALNGVEVVGIACPAKTAQVRTWHSAVTPVNIALVVLDGRLDPDLVVNRPVLAPIA